MAVKNISELDFDNLKESFKEFLGTQEAFTDYDFEGSNMQVLLNVLAYNTYNNNFYLNMALNEAFLDSAVKRGSIVSRAKELGYTPRSTISSEIHATIVATNLLPDELVPSMTLARGTRFRGIDANNTNSYYFIVTEPVTAEIQNNSFTYPNVTLKEGVILGYSFTVDKVANPNLIFEIPHDNVDITTIRVRVQESIGSQVVRTYDLASNVYDVTADSLVYYIQENYRGKYEIQFGDGVLGQSLETGNIILIDYVSSSGSIANGISKLIGVDPIGLVSVDRSIITVLDSSSGGSSKETPESIRLNASQMHSTQNRAVTIPDYVAFLRKNFGNLEAINAWGGEDNDPPIYGKVFISLKPYDGLFVSDFAKQNIIKELLKNSGMATVTPEFVDPTFLHIASNVTIKFDSTKTNNSSNSIKNLALIRIDNFFSSITRKFNQTFSVSNFIKDIQAIDSSINSITAKLYVNHRETIIPQSTQGISFTLNNNITPSSFTSNLITISLNQVNYNVFVKDKPTDFKSTQGILTVIDENRLTVIDNAGTINYNSGIISINPIRIISSNSPNDQIIFNALLTGDIFSSKNQLIIQDDVLFGKYENVISGTRVSVSES